MPADCDELGEGVEFVGVDGAHGGHRRHRATLEERCRATELQRLAVGETVRIHFGAHGVEDGV